ncbi:MAG: phosphoribosylpyrophosphate synthetase, partial [Candidatus Electrothrix sp. AR3]|nr:phosphoribosylpyrophosphate synthetase [Candidatus Electrothrix sp. AR3]
MTRRENILLLANSDTIPLADKIAAELGIVCTPMIQKKFADGE